MKWGEWMCTKLTSTCERTKSYGADPGSVSFAVNTIKTFLLSGLLLHPWAQNKFLEAAIRARSVRCPPFTYSVPRITLGILIKWVSCKVSTTLGRWLYMMIPKCTFWYILLTFVISSTTKEPILLKSFVVTAVELSIKIPTSKPFAFSWGDAKAPNRLNVNQSSES